MWIWCSQRRDPPPQYLEGEKCQRDSCLPLHFNHSRVYWKLEIREVSAKKKRKISYTQCLLCTWLCARSLTSMFLLSHHTILTGLLLFLNLKIRELRPRDEQLTLPKTSLNRLFEFDTRLLLCWKELEEMLPLTQPWLRLDPLMLTCRFFQWDLWQLTGGRPFCVSSIAMLWPMQDRG